MTIEQLLRDPNTELTDEFLTMALGDSFALWQAFNEKLLNFDISLEWRHYKDGGWLAKATNKKKLYFGVLLQMDFFGKFQLPRKTTFADRVSFSFRSPFEWKMTDFVCASTPYSVTTLPSFVLQSG